MKVYAYCAESGKIYQTELNCRGHNITEDTPSDKVWEIARKEMKASFGKPVTCWCFCK